MLIGDALNNVSIMPQAAKTCGAVGGAVSGFISGTKSANAKDLCGVSSSAMEVVIDGVESGMSLIRDVGDKANTHHEEIIKEIENSGNFNCY